MKYISFKIIILCMLMPPLFYVFSMQTLERHLKDKYTSEIEAIYIGDTRLLFNGSVRLKDAIHKNIDSYLKGRLLLPWGVRATVMVATKQNTILYPSAFEEKEDTLLSADPMQIASENYDLLNEGLIVNVDTKLGYNTILSSSLLASYIFLSVFVLYFYYRSGMRKAGQEDTEKGLKIDHLLEAEKEYTDKLKVLARDREKLVSELERVKEAFENEKKEASRNEDEMLGEVIALEKKLENNLALRNKQHEEISKLKEEIKRYSKEKRNEDKQKTKASEAFLKRFNALYKNISIHEKAVNGFIDLPEDLRIKSEEIIHQLNESPKIVPIKRKVFGKKGRETVFEVMFAYNGRLYYRMPKDNRIEVLAIGTKNTQLKDLEFLGKI
jgi:hypothetical protein